MHVKTILVSRLNHKAIIAALCLLSLTLSQIFLEIRFPLMSLACNRQCASYPQHTLKGCVNGHLATSIICRGLEYGRIVSLEHMVFWRALLYSRYLSSI